MDKVVVGKSGGYRFESCQEQRKCRTNFVFKIPQIEEKISACHAEVTGSIPGLGSHDSSVGRAVDSSWVLISIGRRFKSGSGGILRKFLKTKRGANKSEKLIQFKPIGLRRNINE